MENNDSAAGVADVKALVFDIFGTTVDWHGSLVRVLSSLGDKYSTYGNWSDFAATWRSGYAKHVRSMAEGGTGSTNIDDVHREILENILASPEWKTLGSKLNEEERTKLNSAWHYLYGWPDVIDGLCALKQHKIIVALSNGNVRLLVDMAKRAGLPWDVIFSAELFGALKPDPRAYQGAMNHLSLKPEECAMVAAHAWDLRGAAQAGMKTIYIKRDAHEPKEWEEEVKTKSQGGQVDLIVDSFTELAVLFAEKRFQ